VPDADLNPAVLAREVGTLLDPEVNARMRTAALGLARPDAATRIADLVVELAAARTRQSHD
jgi:UDP-N-acetylglucosamine:LPS N-acetylglucosamine transferase